MHSFQNLKNTLTGLGARSESTIPSSRNRLLRGSAVLTCCGVLSLLAGAQRQVPSTGITVGLGGSPTAVPARAAHQANPVEGGVIKSTTKPDVVGTYSVENFQGTQNNLSYTHDSADGFRNYLGQWYAPNFAYRDSGVGTWAFHDILFGQNLDKWTSGTVDYGIDAVLTSFQSSHGGMNNATKVYGTSMGSNWGNTGWTAYSDKMALGGNANSFGDERLRYMFWDTCFSVKWDNGVNPYQTWGARAKGIRMIFGYDTVSVDNPNYGKFFWEEWNKNKTFKTAFLDASWRISHGQSPCMVAFGSTQNEAVNRRDTERMLYWGSVGNSWGAWSYYYAVKSSGGGRGAPSQPVAIPPQIAQRTLSARGNSDAEVIQTARALGIDLVDATLIEERPFGLRAVHTSDSDLFIESDGDFELQLARPSTAGPVGPAVADDVLVARAQELVDRFGLAEGRQLQVSTLRYLGANEASEGSEPGAEQILEKTVVFDQVVDGLPFIDADAGRLEITLDASTQQVLKIRSALKQVANQAAGAVPQPTLDLAAARELAIQTASPAPQPGVAAQVRHEVVPGSEEIGYCMQDGQPLAVYRALLKDPRFEDSRLQEVRIPLANL